MATVTYIIQSHYDPAEREKLERETGQRTDDQSDPWQTESSFSAQRRIRAAPTFVPATISYDEWGIPSRIASAPASEGPNHVPSSSSTAEWYRSLTATSVSCEPHPPPRPLSAPNPTHQDARPCREKTTRNDWFISKVLRSEPPTKLSSPAPSLADLLARDPPLLPSEGRFKPPVWLHIGPSNKGFGMLQRSGWNEGEGLGAHAMRSATRAQDVEKLVPSSVSVGKNVPDMQTTREVLDRTLSDWEASEDAVGESDVIPLSMPTQVTGKASAHMQRSLLTPLPTILKADRLGIGLKAKTEGPYKQSKKRVTHSAAALAAHIRSAEELRRKKAEVGKGRRGFAKVHKREEDWRKSMLSYLNE